MRICLATNNAHKMKEIQSALGKNFPLVSLAEIGCRTELPETQNTIAGNSLQKAKFVFDNYHIGAIADDSGLEVVALNGAPGVDSAFYAGPQRDQRDNMQLLLKNLQGIRDRAASFTTVLTLALPNGRIRQFAGMLEGEIAEEQRGTQGFGYDPVFVPKGSDRTLAEISLEEKNKISHRAIAVKKLVDFLAVAGAEHSRHA